MLGLLGWWCAVPASVAAQSRTGDEQVEARYVVSNLDELDELETEEWTGKALADMGLPVAINYRPGAVIYQYRRADP